MAKLLITEPDGSEPIPFLRGILTRSLLSSGLTFEDAYNVASEVRDGLVPGDSDVEISSLELRNRVWDHLKKFYDEESARLYLIGSATPPITVYVQGDDDSATPFSRGQHQLRLAPCGISAEKIQVITGKVYEELLKKGVDEVSSDTVCDLTSLYLKQEESKGAARRYLNWTRFLHTDRPLLLLIGGAPGTGKSSMAAELAHLLDIVRIQSTDMLREVMRMMIPSRLLPALHRSSFDAWKVLPTAETTEGSSDDLTADGFRTQSELVSVACEGVVQRAMQERVSLILEGVHVYPALQEKMILPEDAIVVPIMLGVLKQKKLRARIKGRSKEAPERHSRRHAKNFTSIWSLQSFLLSEADRAGVPIIENDDREKTIREIMLTISARLESDFGGKEKKKKSG